MSAVHPSALKHGIIEDDIHHALRNSIIEIAQEDMTMSIGPDRNGNLLEIGVINEDDNPIVVHAMRARAKFLR